MINWALTPQLNAAPSLTKSTGHSMTKVLLRLHSHILNASATVIWGHCGAWPWQRNKVVSCSFAAKCKWWP